MERLIAQHLRLLNNVSLQHQRSLMQEIRWDSRLIAIRGARGTGKTTIMLQHIKETFGTDTHIALYVSMDNLYFSRHTLLDLIDAFYLQGGKALFIDEVHKYPGWSREIKNAYDAYPELHIVFTGSSLLNILNAEADLSRRCISYDLQGLSFREYLSFQENIHLPKVSLETIQNNAQDVCAEVCRLCHPLQYFNEYLRSGYYPFFLESHEDYFIRLQNVVNLILEIELPQMCGVEVANIRRLKSLLAILSGDVPFSVDITKLSLMAGMSRNTILGYLQYLDRAKILRLLYSDLSSVKKMQKPDKIYLENPNLLHALALDTVNEGTLREVFFVNQTGYVHRVEYSSSQADFWVDGQYTIEVGGKGKTGRQLADKQNGYIAADGMEYAIGHKIPLWCFGLLY